VCLIKNEAEGEDDVQVKFHPQCEEEGSLVMSIASSDQHVRDPTYSSICVMLNASPDESSVPYPPCLTAPVIHPEFVQLPHVAGCSLRDEEKLATVAPRTMLVLCQPH
jgi:hypothetical protein